MNQASDLTFLRQCFTAKLGSRADLYPEQLEEQFPRILLRINDLWGTPEMDPYFSELTTTTRADRQGFPEAVAVELFRLSNLHSSYDLDGSGKKSPWDLDKEAKYFKPGI